MKNMLEMQELKAGFPVMTKKLNSSPYLLTPWSRVLLEKLTSKLRS